MNSQQARTLVQETFPKGFDKGRFREFTINLLNKIDESNQGQWNSTYIKNAFKEHVEKCERLGTYTSPEDEKLDVLIVHLTRESKLERARTAIRNFVADHLKQRDSKDAALVAFLSPSEKSWRFSYIKMEYAAVEKDDGKVGVQTKLTPARRSSYIVGEDESCHTAQSRFLNLLLDTENNPTLAQVEDAFSVEVVTKEFFEQYKALLLDLKDALDDLGKRDKTIREEFAQKNVSTADFAKKLLGQIVFLYFLQKKGWLGVPRGGDWGDGTHNFLRQLFDAKFGSYKNFFNDILEPLFYDTLATDRGHDAWCNIFKCRIPFLNGGLFEPLADYDWKKIGITIPNALFSNSKRTGAGDTGTGILDVFDRYNFTVNEAEPLEKEVAIDPEMLGKVFENLLEVKERKSKGSFYTPREIVHYMCQESLINYLDTAINSKTEPVGTERGKQGLLGDEKAGQTLPPVPTRGELIPRADIETFIHCGDQASHYEAARMDGASYKRSLPKTIETLAKLLDEKLAAIAVCDPAIGSGAFPVGMMQEIVRARSALTPYFNDVKDRTAYHFKRHAIQSCIYGVDIDPGAVEIAKLRLWLSLVVDEEDVKQIKPLPNLDYKVVVGNSLLGVEKTLFNQERFKLLEELKPKFFDATDRKQKAKCKHEIDDLIHKLTRGKEAFDFEIYFSEVFHRKSGFDCLIGNPPYVDSEQMVRIDPAGREQIAGLFKTTKGNWDLYIPFWESSLKLANQSGCVHLITPNKWLAIDYGESLRELMLPSVERVTDYSRYRAFANVGVFPVAVLASKRKCPQITVRSYSDAETVSHQQVLPKTILQGFGNWGLVLSQKLPLLVKLVSTNEKLNSVCLLQSAFTVSEAYEIVKHLKELGSADKDYFRFINTGTIDPYVTLWGIKQTTYIKVKYAKPIIPKQALFRHFPKRYDRANSPKIIISGMRHFEAFYDPDGSYVPGKSTVVAFPNEDRIPSKFLLGLLNSTIPKFFFKESYGALAMDGGITFTNNNCGEIPVPKELGKTARQVEKLVDRILAAKAKDADADVSKLEREIDELVYALYGLTPEEIKIVEGAK